MHRRGPWLAWWSLVAVIPLLSLYGRDLLRLIPPDAVDRELTLGLAMALFLLVYLAAHWLTLRKGRGGLWHLLWLLPLYLVVPLWLSVTVERLHFILFGLLGFVSQQLFRPLIGLGLALSIGGLDELLQWWLPDRVGDWRDVGFNMLAAAGGALLAWVGRRR